LGVISGAEYSSVGGNGTFASQAYVNTDSLIKYTYYGDANFNGKVDGGDYSRIDTNFNNQAAQGNISGWFNGDFDYNGKIDGADYALIDGAFNGQAGSLARAMSFVSGEDFSLRDMNTPALQVVRMHLNQFGDEYATAFLNIPEPSTAITGVALLLSTSGRRRGRRHF
jgi:hypothetical protein